MKLRNPPEKAPPSESSSDGTISDSSAISSPSSEGSFTGSFMVPVRVLSGVLVQGLPKIPEVVPFWGSYIESYKVIPKRNYYGASG